MGTDAPVVSSPGRVYDTHILTWVSLQKPRHPLDRYYTIAEPGLWSDRVRTWSAPDRVGALLQHSQDPALGRGSNMPLSLREEYVSGSRDFW